ncbi:MAG: hypothetical protein EA382_12065 [Spirochaetaceae bacterium]|nr:MAG: hypothetical protein EA382_12065 [Spirochaetaceae bacterium]
MGLQVKEAPPRTPRGSVVNRGTDQFYRIDDYSAMPPFLVSLTSPSDHWMFLSTTGGITAGRRNADHAIFPYGTGDRVEDSATTTGAITIVLVKQGDVHLRWEPFAVALDGIYSVRRSVEKNATGNIITFEEHNADLGLTFRQTWTNSPEYGIVRRCSLHADQSRVSDVIVLDGIRNTLPALTPAGFQAAFSNLLDAYKRNELLPESNLGVFGLSAVPTDAAEPSEALAATTWWHQGLVPEAILLSTEQLDRFRQTGAVTTEHDVKGRRGAYIVVSRLTVGDGVEPEWLFCGEVDQQHTDIVALDREVREPGGAVSARVIESIAKATSRLWEILSRNDGVQQTGNPMTRLHHAANVTYNVMRGGYFAYDYAVPAEDFRRFASSRNRPVTEAHADFFASLSGMVRVDELRRRADALDSPDVSRIAREYLPLTFSRRHGDPSRPWNAFSIESEGPDGKPRLAYQGNWRDIFQNWEALLLSSPAYTENVISKFLNATTIDGYNPYRITNEGIDWERPDPDAPWANIGYWGDHQIIYLLKLLELSEGYHPGAMKELLARRMFSFADVPYVIASFDRMLQNPYNTISFDADRDRAATQRCEREGSDGKLLHASDGSVVHVTMIEKLLLIALAKASNFVPDGGIWMNTQRPEWNDANNALVGKGVSVVTTAYLHRYATFVLGLLAQYDESDIRVLEETATWTEDLLDVLRSADSGPEKEWSPASRLDFMRRCGNAAGAFRERVSGAAPGRTTDVRVATLKELFEVIKRLTADTVERNRCSDELYHSYNTISIERDERGDVAGIAILPLYPMLEGQVAAISSAAVDPEQSARTLEALRSSTLYRDDQCSYMLYPNRELRGFMDRNVIDPRRVGQSGAIGKLLTDPEQTLVSQDVEGGIHFNPLFRNATLLEHACRDYAGTQSEPRLTDADIRELLDLYEHTFEHQYFTGRSGTFYGYEGLGSIYWHMVSKLLLATQENALRAHQSGDDRLAQKLRSRYFDVRSGIGFNKEPAEYGAFPTDPYSHTPYGGGAKQPGMTGQVKEEIITRFAELGLIVSDGQMVFDRFLVEESEFLSQPSQLVYVDVHGNSRTIDLDAGSFAFTFCQTPIIVSRGGAAASIALHRGQGQTETIDSLRCPAAASREVFDKSGAITRIDVTFE